MRNALAVFRSIKIGQWQSGQNSLTGLSLTAYL
ncbi:MAG: hypothetical protein ACI9IJ_002433, partial [Psychromonas sp.]